MIKNIARYIPSIAFPILINFIIMYFNANILTPEEFGLYNIYLNSINLIYALIISYLQQAAFRFYSTKDYYDSEEMYLSTYFYSIIFSNILLLFILIILNMFYPSLNILLISVSVFLNSLFQFYLNKFRLENRYNKFTLHKIISSFFYIILYLSIFIFFNNINYSLPLYALYGSYSFAIFAETFRLREKIKIRQFSFKLLKYSFKYGYPLIGVSLMNIVLTSSDQYLILFFLSENEVGFYSLGYRFGDTIVVNIAMIILLVMYPLIMKHFDNGEINQAEENLKKAINLNFLSTVPIVLFIFININIIITIFFPNYIGAEVITRLVLVVSIFHSLSMYTSKGLELAKKTKSLLLILTVAGFINIIFNIIFIPIFGLYAAAYSSIISYLVYSLSLIKGSKDFISITFDWNYILKVFYVTSIAVLSSELLSLFWEIKDLFSLITHLILGALVYILCLVRLKMFEEFKD